MWSPCRWVKWIAPIPPGSRPSRFRARSAVAPKSTANVPRSSSTNQQVWPRPEEPGAVGEAGAVVERLRLVHDPVVFRASDGRGRSQEPPVSRADPGRKGESAPGEQGPKRAGDPEGDQGLLGRRADHLVQLAELVLARVRPLGE